MPKLRKLAQFAQTYLPYYLERKRMQEQSELVGTRQLELAKFNAMQSLWEKGLNDPALLARLQRNGVTDINGFPVAAGVPDATDASGAVGKEITESGDYGKVYTPEDIDARYHGSTFTDHADDEDRAPIERLIAQANARREALKGAMTPTRVEDIDSAGTGRARYVNPLELGKLEPLQTERTGAQEGERETANYMASEGSRPWVDRSILNTNLTEAGTRGEKLTTKRGEEQIANSFNMAELRQQHLYRTEEAKTARDEERRKLPAAMAERVAGIDASLYSAGVLRSLYETAGSDIPDQLGPVMARAKRLQNKMPLLPTDPEFSKFQAHTATLKNSIIKAITGAQMSEAEATRIITQIPVETDKPEVWEQKMQATEENLTMLRDRMMMVGSGNLNAAPTLPNISTPKPGARVAPKYRMLPDGTMVEDK